MLGEQSDVGHLSSGVSLHSHSHSGLLIAYKTVLDKLIDLSRSAFSSVQWENKAYSIRKLWALMCCSINISCTLSLVYIQYILPFSVSVPLNLLWRREEGSRNCLKETQPTFLIFKTFPVDFCPLKDRLPESTEGGFSTQELRWDGGVGGYRIIWKQCCFLLCACFESFLWVLMSGDKER